MIMMCQALGMVVHRMILHLQDRSNYGLMVRVTTQVM